MNITRIVIMRMMVLVMALCSGVFSYTVLADAPNTTKVAVNSKSVVNINSANEEALATLLTGVGSKKAKAIIEYRDLHGQFKSAEELTAVKGIGPATVEKNRQRITF